MLIPPNLSKEFTPSTTKSMFISTRVVLLDFWSTLALFNFGTIIWHILVTTYRFIYRNVTRYLWWDLLINFILISSKHYLIHCHCIWIVIILTINKTRIGHRAVPGSSARILASKWIYNSNIHSLLLGRNINEWKLKLSFIYLFICLLVVLFCVTFPFHIVPFCLAFSSTQLIELIYFINIRGWRIE